MPTDQSSTGEALPFSNSKQEALLGYLLTDEKFFLLARNRIKPEWWTQGRLQQLWVMASDFGTKYNRAPMASEISECPAMCGLDLAEQNRLRTVLSLCVHNTTTYRLDALSSELTDWLHARTYITTMTKSAAVFNQAMKTMETAKYQQVYQMHRDMVRAIDDISFEPGQAELMDDAERDFRLATVDATNAISFGLPPFDRLLLPEGNGKGSLLRGDMTVLLAPTNQGKTSTMITVATLNIMDRKDVLLVTHEGRPSDIRLKIWCSMLGESRKEVLAKLGDKEHQNKLLAVTALINKHLEYLPLNKAGMTVEETEAIIRQRQERWKATHGGKGFDLIVDDYPAKLTTMQAKGGQWAQRQIQEIVYNYFSQIALEHNVHVLTAIQTNREGSKVNNRLGGKTGAESRLLAMEDVMEAWGPMTTATNVISINRDPVAQARGVVTFYICKSRSSEVGWAICCKSNFAAARSHSLDSPATWYRGTSAMSEKIGTLLEGFSGREISLDEVRIHEAG